MGKKHRFALALAFVLGMTGGSAPASAQSDDNRNRHVTVHNHTDTTIWEFYASTTHETRWEEDILGGTVIISGESMRMRLDDGTGRCHYDIKVVFKGGESRTRGDIDVCAVSDLHVYANRITAE